MRFAILLTLVSTAFAENKGDASALIQEVAEAAKSTTSWSIEGSVEESGYAWRDPPAQFTVLMRAPDEVRFEQRGGSTPAMIVCDSVNAWVYSPPLNRYRRQPAAQSTLCSPIVGDWKALPGTLKSPVFAGHRAIDVGGQTLECEMVRATSEPPPPASGRIKREMCIDLSKKEIIWEKEQSSYGNRTYIYRRIDRGGEPPASGFEFEPPPGSLSSPYDLPVPSRFGSLAIPLDPGVSLPHLLSKQDPVYDEASRRAGIEGTVMLYVVIDSSGTASDIEVFRPLGPGLDAAAIQSVRQWRFAPAMKENQPTAIATVMALTFKRP
ncbi:MAG: TonB family protein [Bryobacteraceae bacterium]